MEAKNLKELVIGMCAVPSVSGHETYLSEALEKQIGDMFDEHYTDAVGNQIYIRRCGKENAPKILVDSHFDEIGMIVTEILDGGFLRMTNIGGVDTRILEASRVVVYGKQKINAVIASVPAHLRKNADKLTPLDELLVDTGYTKEWLDENIPLGSFIGFEPEYTELLNERIVGKAFDDKSCGACAVWGIINTPKEKLAGDIYCLFSVQEERGMLGGKTGAYSVDPDIALVMDVCHATMPDAECRMKMEEGVMISHSALTDRKLTKELIKVCEENEVRFKTCAEATGTGTNANVMGFTGAGIPVVLVSLPIKSMHSANEALSIIDAEELAKVVGLFVSNERLIPGKGETAV